MALKNDFIILKKFKRGDYEGKSLAEIHRAEKRDLALSEKSLDVILKGLVKSGKIGRKNGKYYLLEKSEKKSEKKQNVELLTGKLRCNERGFGFITVDGDKDFFVAPDKMGGALNTDTVEFKVLSGKNGARDAAEVVKIVERGVKTLVGTVFYEDGLTYVRPDDRAYLADIYVLEKKRNGAKRGDKVFLTIEKFPLKGCLEGSVNVVIGKSNEFFAEEQAILYASSVAREFSAEALSEARALGSEVSEKDLVGRVDLRKEKIFTIDGDSSKDFDDAVSLSRLENGGYRLGVHIADVTAYVKGGSAVDEEAFERGTSAYFPDKVIPMLPFELSDGLCSLNEGVDRLAVSVISEMDGEGNVLKTDIFESVIRSVRRMTYKNVDKIIDGDVATREKYADIASIVDDMNELRLLLEKKRIETGYVELETRDGDISLDNGKIEIELHKATNSTKLIEQFMVFANERVAEYLSAGDYPCVYRVHEVPPYEKIEALKVFLSALGISVGWKSDEVTSLEMARLVRSVAGKPTEGVVNRTVLRSMCKAKYSVENLGHFGLASQKYCHFTSPIRRYADLAVHRVLKAALNGQIALINDVYADFCVKAAQRASERERVSEECERTVDDLYKAKYLEDKIGEEFEGVVSGVLSSGIFVELENTCEGFVPLELMPSGRYNYDAATFTLSSGKRSYRLGQRVKITVASVDCASRRVDFILNEKDSCKKKRSVIK